MWQYFLILSPELLMTSFTKVKNVKISLFFTIQRIHAITFLSFKMQAADIKELTNTLTVRR